MKKRIVILKFIKDISLPLTILTVLLLTNLLTRIDKFRNILQPDEETITVTIDNNNESIIDSEEADSIDIDKVNFIKNDILNLYYNKKYDSTLTLINKKLNLKQNSPTEKSQLYYLSSLCWLMKKNYSNSLNSINSAIKNSSKNYKYYYIKGLLLNRLNNPHKAFINFKKAISLNKNYLLPYKNIAGYYISISKYDSAKIYLKKTLNISRFKDNSYYKLGKIAYFQGSLKKALKYCNLSIKYNPKYINPKILKLKIYLKYKNQKEINETFNKIYNTIENRVYAKSIIEELIDTKNYELALQLINKFLKYNKEDIDFLYLYAKIMGLTNRDAIALSTFKKIEQAGESSPTIYYNIAKNCSDLGYKNEAIYYYNKAIELNPYYDKALYNLSILYSKENNFPEAIKLLKKSLKTNPSNKKSKYNLALAYLKSKRYYKSLDYFMQLLETDSSINILYNTAQIYIHLNDYEQAKTILKKAILKYPNNFNLHYKLLLTYKKLKDYKEAFKLIDKMKKWCNKEQTQKILYQEAYLLYLKHDYKKSKEIISKIMNNNNKRKFSTLLAKIYSKENDTLALKSLINNFENTNEDLEEKITLLTRIKKYNNALTIVDTLIKRDSLNTKYIKTKLFLLRKTKKYSDAISFINLINNNIIKNNIEIKREIFLNKTYLNDNKKKELIKLAKEILEIAPGDFYVRYKLALIYEQINKYYSAFIEMKKVLTIEYRFSFLKLTINYALKANEKKQALELINKYIEKEKLHKQELIKIKKEIEIN